MYIVLTQGPVILARL